jgi:hypothetical protein
MASASASSPLLLLLLELLSLSPAAGVAAGFGTADMVGLFSCLRVVWLNESFSEG